LRLNPNASLQLGLYIVDSCAEIISGKLDQNLQQFRDILIRFQCPIYLRIGYEFDYEYNHYDPQEYQAAYRYIAEYLNIVRCHSSLTRNCLVIAYVWHASGQNSYHPNQYHNVTIASWYPGDEYVDWCGISIFEQPYQCNSSKLCVMAHVDDFLKHCRRIDKPIMIAESTPFGGIIGMQ
jgi:beta-mannanase